MDVILFDDIVSVRFRRITSLVHKKCVVYLSKSRSHFCGDVCRERGPEKYCG